VQERRRRRGCASFAGEQHPEAARARAAKHAEYPPYAVGAPRVVAGQVVHQRHHLQPGRHQGQQVGLHEDGRVERERHAAQVAGREGQAVARQHGGRLVAPALEGRKAGEHQAAADGEGERELGGGEDDDGQEYEEGHEEEEDATACQAEEEHELLAGGDAAVVVAAVGLGWGEGLGWGWGGVRATGGVGDTLLPARTSTSVRLQPPRDQHQHQQETLTCFPRWVWTRC